MSKTTTCPKCQAENPLGSKYCNNCGADMPPSTSIICHNCETPNPRNRLYCDNCGSKLVKKAPPAPPPPPVEEQPSIKRFDLPSRPPGDTSDLDPTAVPDWLRTGEHDATPDSDSDQPATDTDETAVASDKADTIPAATGGLPEWLTEGEEDAESFFGTPPEITTDLYLDLVEDEEASDTSHKQAKEADETWPVSPASDEEQSWLDELGPAYTNIFGQSDEDDDHPFDPTAELPDLPDWLSDIGPAHTGTLDSSSVQDQAGGWLDEFSPAYEGDLGEPDAPVDLEEFAFTDPISPDEDDEETGVLPDWLASLRAEDNTNDTVADFTEDSEDLAAATDADLSLFDFEEEDEEAAIDSEDLAATTTPDWLTAMEAGGLEEETADDLDQLFADLDAADGDFDFDTPDTPAPAETPDDLDQLFADLDAADSGFDFDTPDTPVPAETPDDLDQLFADLDAADSDFDFDTPDTPAPDEAPDDLDQLFADLDAADDDFTFDTPDTAAPAEAPDDLDQLFADLDADADDFTFDLDDLADDDGGDFAFDLDDLADEADEPGLPDWMMQLSSTTTEEEDSEYADTLQDTGELAQNEELPEWVTEMMPASDQQGVSLSGFSLTDDDYIDPLEGIPEELAAADLPDWLQDAPTARTGGLSASATEPQAEDIPSWLQQTQFDEETVELSAELSDLLGPPTRDKPPQIRQADIPEWLQAMKPAELTGAAVEDHAATSGPLTGIKGALEIEPPIARPQTAAANFLSFTVSKEQQQQVELLQQIIGTETETQPVVGMRRVAGLSLAVRTGLALLLLLTIVVGLWGPALFSHNAPPTAAAENLHTAVQSVAGQPVLLVFDYTPTLAGELDPQAALLLQQLAQNGSHVVSLSQYTAGERLADLQTAVSHPDNRTHLGYLPGEAIGIRQLGYCLAAAPTCTNLVGQTLLPPTQQTVADISLVIILTGERDNLVNWIEQLAVYEELTLAAAVTQGLRPVAAPYVASGQLTGLSAGLSDALSYQQFLLNQPPDNDLTRQQNAQSLAQLVAALILLIGLFVYTRRT